MPLTEKQLEYLKNCNHRWNVKTGATGSGKSFLDFTVIIPQRIFAAKGEGLLVLLGNCSAARPKAAILSPLMNRSMVLLPPGSRYRARARTLQSYLPVTEL